MTREQFTMISKIDLRRSRVDVLINKNLTVTRKRFGVSSSMTACAGDGKTYRLEKIYSDLFQCCTRLLDDILSSTSSYVYSFDAGDLELCNSLKPLTKQEPVLLNYDLESERKMFD
jgi:hypothetical protein